MSDGCTRALRMPDMSIAEDARLVSLARSGVASAFDELFRRHSRRVHDLAYHMLCDRDAADDVVQEVFVRVHGGLGRFRGQCSLRGWILRIAVNQCVSHRRRARRLDRQRCELEDEAADYRPSGPAADRAGTAHQALRALRPVDRVLLVMRDVQGYSYEEIGEALGCSGNSVGVRLHRARTRLRREFERLSAEERG